MKLFHLFFLLILCISCVNQAQQQADLLNKEFNKISILSLPFDSLLSEARKLPYKERIECILNISFREEERIDGISKQEELLIEVLPLSESETRKNILLRLITLYSKLDQYKLPKIHSNSLSYILELENNRLLSDEERWFVKKNKALILNRLGKQDEYLPIWYELLEEHRNANKPQYILEDLITIANHFHILGVNEQAISMYKEALQLCIDNSLDESYNKSLLSLIDQLCKNGNYSEALEYFKSIDIDRFLANNTNILNVPIECYMHLDKPDSARFYIRKRFNFQDTNKMLFNCQMAETYILEQKEDSALIYLNIAIQDLTQKSTQYNPNLPLYFLPVYSSLANLLQKKGKVKEANQAFMFVEPLMKTRVTSPQLLNQQIKSLSDFSNLCRSTKQYEKALDLLARRDSIQLLYNDIKEQKDSRNLVERFKIQDMQHTINIQKIVNDSAQRQLALALTSIIILGAFITLLVIVIIRSRKKDVTIYQQQETIQKITEVSPPNEGETDIYKATYIDALSRVINEKLFLQNDLTLHTLADLLKTNRTYLSRGINENAKVNFSIWLNNLRIDYAVKLMHADTAINLATLPFQCGFNSKETFYRNFERHCNFKPAEYLKQIIKEQNQAKKNRVINLFNSLVTRVKKQITH